VREELRVSSDGLRRSRCPATVRRGRRWNRRRHISAVASDRSCPIRSPSFQPMIVAGAKTAAIATETAMDRRRRRRFAKTRTRTLSGASRPPPPPLNQPRWSTTKVIASTVHIGRVDRFVSTIPTNLWYIIMILHYKRFFRFALKSLSRI